MSKERKTNGLNNNKEKLAKKVDFAEAVRDGATLMGGLLTGFAATGLLMGGAAEIGSNLVMDKEMASLHASAEYQMWVAQMSDMLINALTSGEISFDEYNESVQALLSEEGVVAYSEIAGDEKLSEFVKSYEQSKDLSKQTFGKGLPIFGSSAVASFAVAGLAGKKKNKEKKKLEELEVSFQEKI